MTEEYISVAAANIMALDSLPRKRQLAAKAAESVTAVIVDEEADMDAQAWKRILDERVGESPLRAIPKIARFASDRRSDRAINFSQPVEPREEEEMVPKPRDNPFYEDR